MVLFTNQVFRLVNIPCRGGEMDRDSHRLSKLRKYRFEHMYVDGYFTLSTSGMRIVQMYTGMRLLPI